ncbi:hypothetical protein [uncultured Mediterranean phage]|nr:hypothetical protein [uncultured Mediterranean phage]
MYIGKTPTVGNFQKCDAITTSATATYNLLVGGVAVSPETANHCIVSLNGVIQAPTSAFTISGSTIVFNSALTSADVIDFILLLGSVLNIGTPSDNVVSTAKIVDDAVTLAKMAAGTDGNIISYDASGNPVAIATGTSGHFLKSQGAGAQPVFAAAGGGKIGQVISATQTTASTATPGGTFTNITGLSCAITPAATSSKVWITYNVSYTFGGPNNSSALRIARDGTGIAVADAAGSAKLGSSTDHGWDFHTRFGSSSQNFLDSPSSTSALTYTIQWISPDNATLYLNRSVNAATGSNVIRTVSTMTVMEVLA